MKKVISLFMFLIIFTLLAACSTDSSTDAVESDEAVEETEGTEASDSENNSESDIPYPEDTITMVTATGPGGAGDIMTRKVAELSEKFFGEKVVVENKQGGSGSIALNEVNNREADGYTILYHSSTLPLTMAAGTIPFTSDDVVPIASMVSNHQLLAVPKDSEFETFEEFASYAKENPGELDVVATQINGTNHVFALKIMNDADIEFNYVAYDGSGEAVTRIIGGNGDAIAVSGNAAIQQIESGDLRVLAVSSSERVPTLPDVPTFKELGLDSIDDELIWRGFFVKPGTPEDIVAKIEDVLKQVTETSEFEEYAASTNQDIYFNTGEEFHTIFNNYYNSAKELFEKEN